MRLVPICAIAMAIFISATVARAQPSVPDNSCAQLTSPNTGSIKWFLSLSPSSDLLSTWCAIQTLKGDVTFDVYFPATNAHRSWKTSFSDQPLPATRIIDIIQSVIPTADGPREDERGQPFSQVLTNVVQLRAKVANNNDTIGFSPEHPAADELALWEPIELRVKPVMIAGQEFKLAIKLRPDMGMLALMMQKRATDIKFNGWKGRLSLGGYFSGKCSNQIPNCEQLPEVVSFHAPWIMSGLQLKAEGYGMTNSAIAIQQQLINTNGKSTHDGDARRNFDLKTGESIYRIEDDNTELTMEASGSPSGTDRITITYRTVDGNYSIKKYLDAAARQFRMSAPKKPVIAPNAPEALDRL